MATRKYDLEERLLTYSTRMIRLVESLPNTRTGNHIANQLLRSGTAAYPHHGEAQAAESQRDFIHKMMIALKELRESERWLFLIQRVPLVDPPKKLNELIDETDALIRIFVTSINTARENSK